MMMPEVAANRIELTARVWSGGVTNEAGSASPVRAPTSLLYVLPLCCKALDGCVPSGETTPMPQNERPLKLEPPTPPPALSDRAFENLRFIRETMEAAGAFTAISGTGITLTGFVALVAMLIAGNDLESPRWLLTWIAAAPFAFSASVHFTVKKTRASAAPFTSAIARKLALAFFPSLVAGAVLTAVAVRAEWYPALPGMWLMLYGAAVMAGGALSVPIIPVMGATFMTLGAMALAAPLVFAGWPLEARSVLLNGLMAAGFGGVHVLFGLAISRRYGG